MIPGEDSAADTSNEALRTRAQQRIAGMLHRLLEVETSAPHLWRFILGVFVSTFLRKLVEDGRSRGFDAELAALHQVGKEAQAYFSEAFAAADQVALAQGWDGKQLLADLDLAARNFDPGLREFLGSLGSPIKPGHPGAADGNERGLFAKYRVERIDGKPLKGGGCLVLEFGDPRAIRAIRQSAYEARAAGKSELADDLMRALVDAGNRATPPFPNFTQRWEELFEAIEDVLADTAGVYGRKLKIGAELLADCRDYVDGRKPECQFLSDVTDSIEGSFHCEKCDGSGDCSSCLGNDSDCQECDGDGDCGSCEGEGR